MSRNAHIDSAAEADRLLEALGQQLTAQRQRFELVVIGGAALLALGLVSRVTQDVDVVALADGSDLLEALPLPAALVEARDRVARDLALPDDWLNSQAAKDMLRLGLPRGFAERLTPRAYGPGLVVHYASRLDQIHLKLHAAVDHGGPGKHLSDLETLAPTPDELVRAARWTRTHDPSPGYLSVLIPALAYLGVKDADLSD